MATKKKAAASTETVQATIQYVVVEPHGQYHIRYIVDGRTVDDGRCGADSNWAKIDAVPEDIEPSQLCGFCWRKEG